ncbi:MAG: Mrp/NBP35 family ATP-binding protein [Chloroflexi bacterium]|nr:Mrp/NBP35 family ATP-binding protein [Chloroflexota bacterium]
MTDNKAMMDALRQVMDPELGKNIVELGMVQDLKINKAGEAAFTLTLTVLGCPMREQMAEQSQKALLQVPGVKSVKIEFARMDDATRQKLFETVTPQLPALKEFNKVKRVVAVMSGKGGVGKSTVTALLAGEARRQCLKVGVLDADITGPSIPRLFGLPSGGLPQSEMGILPAYTESGIKIISTNVLLPDEDTPVIWRGPLITRAITQFWEETLWGELDLLLVDMPPGTSDAALTVMQKLPIDGIILVTTPQALAGMVVRKAVHLAKELKTPILGLVENMSYFRCPDNGKEYEIFGPSHAKQTADMAGVASWIRVPIDPQVNQLFDAGKAEEARLPEIQSKFRQLVFAE